MDPTTDAMLMMRPLFFLLMTFAAACAAPAALTGARADTSQLALRRPKRTRLRPSERASALRQHAEQGWAAICGSSSAFTCTRSLQCRAAAVRGRGCGAPASRRRRR